MNAPLRAGNPTEFQRLSEAVYAATGRPLPTAPWQGGGLARLDPSLLRSHLERHCGDRAERIRIAGTLDRRLVLVEQPRGGWQVADLSGHAHALRDWPAWTRGHLFLEDETSWLSRADLDEYAVERLSRPRVLLAALYHPEHFPLPRFPLGISDVARAARTTLMGEVELVDMQLGTGLDEIIDRLADRPYDILGISGTFGQHDLMVQLLRAVYGFESPPVVIAGGSLTARNEALLLESFPELWVARAGGEPTIQGLMHHWHGDLERDQVPGLGYNGAPRGGALGIGRRRTAKPPASAAVEEALPELDLLPATFTHHGVAQMETSRGCTNFCSFCPRGHKGIWSGLVPGQLPWMLEEMGAVFDHFPEVARVLYLVDEEFIGQGADAAERALEVAGMLHRAELAWESSCRIDQVVHPERDETWHGERAAMWRNLVGLGLRRMLFGVESGVDSVLERFNKETVGEQNALAIRTLSALGVPTRYTYITFDPLMSLEELKATHTFQGRTDLLLSPQPQLSPQEIVRGVGDEDFVAAHSTGRALHTGISYMLVSMECLIGAAYTRKVAAAGLAGRPRPAMGRVDARFADWRIGVASEWAQRWVDRNFALDYTLKSLEKVLDHNPRDVVRQARTVLKGASYTVLGQMIEAIEATSAIEAQEARRSLETGIESVLTQRLGVLKEQMARTVASVATHLPPEHARVLHREHERWQTTSGWRLINAADPCGT